MVDARGFELAARLGAMSGFSIPFAALSMLFSGHLSVSVAMLASAVGTIMMLVDLAILDDVSEIATSRW